MCHASIPLKFWDEIFSSIVYLINRLPSHSSIPYELLFHKAPNYNFLRILGCLCFPFTRPYNKHKLQFRSQPCVFLGYGLSQKGYRCLDLSFNKIFVSRNVQFDETNFPFKHQSQSDQPPPTEPSALCPLPVVCSGPQPVFNLQGSASDPQPAIFLSPLSGPLLPPSGPSSNPTHSPPDPLSSTRHCSLTPPISAAPLPTTRTTSLDFHPSDFHPPSTHPSPTLTHPTTLISPLLPPSGSTALSSLNSISSLPDTTLYQTTNSPSITTIPSAQTSTSLSSYRSTTNLHPMITRTKDRTRQPKQFPQFQAHHARPELEPTTFNQANQSPNWRDAMSSELNALAKNNTWTLVPPPSTQKVIGCKWVYKIKRKTNGELDRYKARLVAKGFNQQPGVDYEETYSPVIRATTIRVVLSLAVSSNWHLHQLDVSNVFLNGDLTETVYMDQPPGFSDPSHPDYVCLFHKSLYGLKQAPRAWFEKLSTTLQEMHFKPSCYDPSLFICHSQGHTLLILVYVDDLIVTGDDYNQVRQCINHLKDKFVIRDLGTLHYFLGIKVTQTAQGLFLSQTKYLTDLLHRANMFNTKPCLTPMASGTSLFQNPGPICTDPVLYRTIVGALQYATLTRPDIAFPVNKVSQFMHQPTDDHWSAVKRILRYVAGTLHMGITIYRQSPTQIHAYSDADWAGSLDDRRSTSGFCVFLGRNLVSWCAKKQPTVSRSSTEAEYRSLALTSTEILWLQHLLSELLPSLQLVPTLWYDNSGATFLAANPMFHARTKHIEIDYHFVREQVAAKRLNVQFLCSADQLADVMTKPLPFPRFQFFRSKLNVTDLPLA